MTGLVIRRPLIVMFFHSLGVRVTCCIWLFVHRQFKVGLDMAGLKLNAHELETLTQQYANQDDKEKRVCYR